MKRTPLVIALIITSLLVASLTGCSDRDHAQKVLEAEGYTGIHLTGWEPFGCGEDDHFTDGFTANGPRGHYVEGVVCCGWLKNCTVRIE